jgi:hypothetical protein
MAAWARVSVVPENTAPLPDFTRWPSFPFEGDMRIKNLAPAVEVEPPRSGEDAADCIACNTPDDAYVWVSERWRVRAMDRPTGLPMVLILECRSHLDMGDLPNLLAAELGVMTVRLERAIRSLDGVARVHVNRWGDGSAHLHMWFLARPYGRLQLRGTFLSLWDDILPVIPEQQWRENLALVAAWLAEFGGRANAEPAHIQWQSPSTISEAPSAATTTEDDDAGAGGWRPTNLADVEGTNADTARATEYLADARTQGMVGSAMAAAMAGAQANATEVDANSNNAEADDPAASTDAPRVGSEGPDRGTPESRQPEVGRPQSDDSVVEGDEPERSPADSTAQTAEASARP